MKMVKKFAAFVEPALPKSTTTSIDTTGSCDCAASVGRSKGERAQPQAAVPLARHVSGSLTGRLLRRCSGLVESALAISRVICVDKKAFGEGTLQIAIPVGTDR